MRLMDGNLLSPIIDEDFFINEHYVEDSPEFLNERGLKSGIQCPRKSSLFRYESFDGQF